MPNAPRRSMRPMTRPMPEEGNTSRALEEVMMRPRMRPADLAERAERQKAMDSSDATYRASRREAEDMDMQNYADGGMVRGCKAGQMSGKGFSGTY